MDRRELDIENFQSLLAYLRASGRIAAIETPLFTNLAGGVSNRTVLVQRPSGESWVLKQALNQLRVQVEWFSDPRRVEREAAAMKCLATLAPQGTITPLIFLDAEHHLLAMQAVPQPHENWKTMLLRGQLNSDHVAQFARLLADVHRRAAEAADRLSVEFEDRSFFESLRLEPYYAYTAGQVPQASQFLHDLIDTTRATRFTLVHGDYSPKNVLVHADRLILLDHEVAHFGDGSFDLGFALTHLLSKAHYLKEARARFAEAARAFWKIYRATIGNPSWAAKLEQRAVAQTMGCLLARCAGRSPLEYLNADQRQRQQQAVVAIISKPPTTIESLVAGFLNRIELLER
jgi:5-methylthioribose kinase